MLIRAYRMRGHMEANLDPLGLAHKDKHPELDPSTYGFTAEDMDRTIFINYYLGMKWPPCGKLLRFAAKPIVVPLGSSFYIFRMQKKKHGFKVALKAALTEKALLTLVARTILERLTQAEGFEGYLDKKFRGTKRFGLDGGESLVPMVEQIFKRGAELGLEEVVLGMAHRGRLNVLANIMQKPYHKIFAEFQGISANPDGIQGSGDVKYHLGTSADREFDGVTLHLSLNPNPSHLEAVNTVVLGKVRAKQDQRMDKSHDKVMAILLHGDAAFIGQGIVAETFLLSQLDGYKTGGTIHIAINNQIGFTTSPSYSRSSPYCSDMAKSIDAPVFHVNGDDPEACVHVARLAMEYRQRFKKDVVIDMWCYRRHGHNEGDEPMFTQPLMYKAISKHPSTRTIYAKFLEENGYIPAGEAERIRQRFTDQLDKEFDAAKNYRPNKADWLEGQWSGIKTAAGGARGGNWG